MYLCIYAQYAVIPALKKSTLHSLSLLTSVFLFLSAARYDIRYEKEDFLLRIKKATSSDQGTFTCIAENRVGKVEASAYLTVRGG